LNTESIYPEFPKHETGVLPSLPKGWTWTTLAAIAELKGGITKGQKRKAQVMLRSVPYLRVANVQRGYLDLDEVKQIEATEEEINELRLFPGDILFNEGGDRDKLGRGWIWRGEIPECIHQNHVFRARLHIADLHPKLISWYGNSFGQQYFVSEGKQTTNLASINLTKLGALPIPLPPVEEQHRIVAEIETQLTRLDVSVAALQRVQANLKRYRASVLQAACEGRLVPTEAGLARAEGRYYEPADQLLQRILQERRAKWEAEQLAEMQAKGNVPKDDRWKSKYKEPIETDTSELPELPEGWMWATVEQVGHVQLGRQRAPKYHHGVHMRPYLRVANVFEDRIDTTDILHMNFTPEEFRTYSLQHGDILLNEGQSLELVGRPAMYRDEVPGACFQNTLVRFRPSQGLTSEFALCVFRSYLHNGRFQRIAKWTTNIAHLGAGRFAEVEFP
jgi:type I restriction enzyme, S subunit